MNYIQELGSIAIASRLKNLSDLLMGDMISVYKTIDIDFEPRWFTFMHLIYFKGPQSITQIASALNQTHPASNQVANALEKKGLIKSKKDKLDHRKRIIHISVKGISIIEKLIPFWNEFEQIISDLLLESSPELLKNISLLEESLSKKPIDIRILAGLKKLQSDKIRIIPFEDKYQSIFKSLNKQWLEKYFEIENEDLKLLNDPKGQIISKNGKVIFAELDNQIIGTAALLELNKKTCELTKMAVEENFQGIQAGRVLLKSIISSAKEKEYQNIILLTSEKLKKAVSLYKSEGFIISDAKSSIKHNLRRCSIQLELNLKTNQ